MNNLGLSLKKFFTNKNTVTIIGVAAIIVIMYFLYTSQVKKATEKVKIPVANREILPETMISKEDIKFIEVAASAKPASVIKESSKIIGKYTGYNVTIPEDGMFYEALLVNQEELPGHWLTQLETNSTGEKQIPCYFGVNVTTTFGNSIKPGDYVDFYVKAYDSSTTENNLIYGKLFKDVKILAVTDNNGKNVFQSQTKIGIPAFLDFGLYTDDYNIFKYAQNASSENIELIVVPQGGKILDEDEELRNGVQITSSELRHYIEKVASDKYPQDSENKEENNSNNNNNN